MADPLDKPSADESVLSRWSRLKRGARIEKEAVSKITVSGEEAELNRAFDHVAEDQLRTAEKLTPTHRTAPTDAHSEALPPPLPSLDEISLERDFTPFMQAKVPEMLKRQALKTLFKDPHFNTMDGLDTYIDDYTQFAPISAAELDGLSAWKSISKPLEQVVTPGGYAVDVESEEGRAVLAARAANKHTAASTPAAHQDESVEPPDTAASEPIARTDTEHASLPHNATASRYGKRVGDFKFVDAPLATDSGELPLRSQSPLAKSLADDPR